MNELRKYKNAFFGLAVVGSLFGLMSDLFLLYTPGIRYEMPGTPDVDYHFLQNLSPEHLFMGQTLGLAMIPLHFFGFLIVFPLLSQVSLVKKVFLGFLAVLLLAYGIHYHGLMLPTQELLRLGGGMSGDIAVDWISHSVKPLETIVVLVYIMISLVLGWEILRGRTQYSKRSLIALPLVPYLVFVALYALQVPASNAIMAMGLNLTFLIFFSYSFLLLSQSANHKASQ